MSRLVHVALAIVAAAFASIASAQDVRITQDVSQATFELNGQTFTIGREQDHEHRLTNDFTKTSRPCPPFCIQPMEASAVVATVGELELIDFLETEVAA